MITDGRFFSVRMLNVEVQPDGTFSDTPVTQKWEKGRMPAAITGHTFIPSRMRLWHCRISNTFPS